MSASDGLKQIFVPAQPITTSITKILSSDTYIDHQYGISALIPRVSFAGETSGDIIKCQLFSQATEFVVRRKS